MLESEGLFNRISEQIEQGRIAESLDILAEHFREENKFPELFETLKAAIRYRLGLPLIYAGEPEDLSTEQQDLLEEQLLTACLEVGTALLQQNDISRGWMYLQPLPDRDQVKTLVEQLAVTDENLDEVVEIALGQWAAPEFGYRLFLDHRGTCNAITFYDTQVLTQSENIRQQLAGILVDHVYRELCENVTRCICENEPDLKMRPGQSLSELIESRDWLFADCGHHLDITHLASVMRIARICQEQQVLSQTMQLAEYGCRLDAQLYLTGEPPFEQIFMDHRIFYQALSGIDVEESVQHFVRKADATNPENEGCHVHEVLIDLLHRTGRSAQAIGRAIEISKQLNNNEFASSMIRFVKGDEGFNAMMQHFRENQDPLSYTLTAVLKHGCNSEN